MDDSTPSQSSVSLEMPSADNLQHQPCVVQQVIDRGEPPQSNVSAPSPSTDTLQEPSIVEQSTEGSGRIEHHALVEHSAESSRDSKPFATQHLLRKKSRVTQMSRLKDQSKYSPLSHCREIFGQAKRITSNRLDNFSNWWLFETLSFLGSLGALFAITIILALHNGSSDQHWLGNITVNSVISWFTALMKAMMLVPIASCISQASWNRYHGKTLPLWDAAIFDSASRGPLGSVQLLLNSKFIQAASVGALVTILGLGIDPLVQQMVRITSQLHDSTETACIGRAYYYTGSDEAVDRVSYRLPQNIMGAIYTGIFMGVGSSNQEPAINPVCPTGNCTFPAYQSLAVCSACQDITHAVEEDCSHDDSILGNPEYCTLSLSNGLKLNQTGDPYSTKPIASSGFLPLIDPPFPRNSFFNFTRIIADPLLRSTRNATQCTLSWCIKTYVSSVTNGRLSESSNSWYGDTNTTYLPFDFGHNWNYPVFELHGPPLNSSTAQDLEPYAVDSDEPSTFTIGYGASNNLTAFLAIKLTLSNSRALSLLTSNESTTAGSYFAADSSFEGASADFAGIVRDPNPSLGALFTNIATTLSVTMRGQAAQLYNENLDLYNVGPCSSPAVDRLMIVNGTSTYNVVIIQVRWGWIAFPATLVFLTGILLATTIIQTRAKGFPVWKSSLVPLAMGVLEEVPGQNQSTTTGMHRTENGCCHITGSINTDVLRTAGGKIAAIERAARDVKVRMIELPDRKAEGDEEKARK